MPEQRFSYFVIFGAMRTGSNLLESILNAFDGLTCLGEIFNPAFVGHHNRDALCGFDMAAREADPIGLIDAIRAQTPGLAGFRFFHDHDPRVLDHCLADPRCAKIVLTRNPVESYVSLEIVRQTGQWKLGNLRNQRRAQAEFDPAAFGRYLDALQGFHLRILNTLQTTGQTAFYLDYEDLKDLAVINGLGRHLGAAAPIETLPGSLKKQNPEPLAQKITNPDALTAALGTLDRFDLSRTPNFEPRRGPAVPGFIAARGAGALYMPVRHGPEARVLAWLEALGGGTERDFNRKTLRRWRRDHPGFRSFTVLRHPLARAHALFCEMMTSGRYPELRRHLSRLRAIDHPTDPADPAYDLDAHRAGFLRLLHFLKGNLGGQTGLRVDAAWASQAAILDGFRAFGGPDLVLREEQLDRGLTFLADELGCRAPDPAPAPPEAAPFPLERVVTEEIEDAAREAYQRDYDALGFGAGPGADSGG